MEGLNLNISENDKLILKSVAPLVIIIILFFVAGRFALSKVGDVRQDIKNAKKMESTLTEKLEVLGSISGLSSTNSNAALIALPESNPSLQVINQLKKLALGNSLLIESMKASAGSSGNTSSLSFVSTTFDITGNKEGISSFVNAIETIAPLTFVENIDMSRNGDEITANITTKTYYAQLPATIPTVTQAVKDLTSSEKELLSSITQLSQAVFTTLEEATATSTITGGSTNPFAE